MWCSSWRKLHLDRRSRFVLYLFNHGIHGMISQRKIRCEVLPAGCTPIGYLLFLIFAVSIWVSVHVLGWRLRSSPSLTSSQPTLSRNINPAGSSREYPLLPLMLLTFQKVLFFGRRRCCFSFQPMQHSFFPFHPTIFTINPYLKRRHFPRTIIIQIYHQSIEL